MEGDQGLDRSPKIYIPISNRPYFPRDGTRKPQETGFVRGEAEVKQPPLPIVGTGASWIGSHHPQPTFHHLNPCAATSAILPDDSQDQRRHQVARRGAHVLYGTIAVMRHSDLSIVANDDDVEWRSDATLVDPRGDELSKPLLVLLLHHADKGPRLVR